ncbi:hypothetical protein, partial [Rhizobium sp. Pop5]|uniref:hypothetical protein n=1 Tax=Rhizobium sp. Pop5 TaxID=1223565 RepID=UPI001969F5AF
MSRYLFDGFSGDRGWEDCRAAVAEVDLAQGGWQSQVSFTGIGTAFVRFAVLPADFGFHTTVGRDHRILIMLCENNHGKATRGIIELRRLKMRSRLKTRDECKDTECNRQLC